LIYSDSDHPEYFFGVGMTFDGNWLQLSISKDTAPVNKLWIAKVQGGAMPVDGNKTIMYVLANIQENWNGSRSRTTLTRD